MRRTVGTSCAEAGDGAKNREKGAKLFRSFAGAGKRKGSTDFKC